MPHDLGIRHIRPGRDTMKIVEIDVNKARYFGRPWKLLGDFDKRKFENVVFLKETDLTLGETKIMYFDGGNLARSLY